MKNEVPRIWLNGFFSCDFNVLSLSTEVSIFMNDFFSVNFVANDVNIFRSDIKSAVFPCEIDSPFNFLFESSPKFFLHSDGHTENSVKELRDSETNLFIFTSASFYESIKTA